MNKKWWYCCLAVLILGAACTPKVDAPEEIPALYTAFELANKGQQLGESGKWREAITQYNKIIAKFGKSTQQDLQEEVAKALYRKAEALLQLGKQDAAVSAYDEVISRFGSSKTPAMQVEVVKSLMDKASIFGAQHQSEAEVKLYDEVITRYGKSSAPNVQNQVSLAFNNKGFNLLLQAKQQWQNEGARNGLLNEALALFDLALKSPTFGEVRAYPLGNTAYSKWLLSRTDEAKAPLREALKLGGEVIHKGEIEDTQQFTVSVDADFVALVNQTWDELHPKPKAKNKSSMTHDKKINL